MVENKTGKRIKFIRFDNGGEYCSKDFEYYCFANGICRQKIVPRSLQENGVVERMNETIMEHMQLHVRMPIIMSVEFVKNIFI